MTAAGYWRVPRAWPGETCFILGGGASLKGFDAEALRGRGRVIAIKLAGIVLAPWADVLFWADPWWCDGNKLRTGHRDSFHLHTGTYKIGCHRCEDPGPYDVKVLGHDGGPFSADPSKLAGPDAGTKALNLARHFGAARAVLLGFDMHGPNWDGRTRRADRENRYASHFMPALGAMAAPLAAAGVEVLNATPGSRLGCFRKVRLEDVLQDIENEPDTAPKNVAAPDRSMADVMAEVAEETKPPRRRPEAEAVPEINFLEVTPWLDLESVLARHARRHAAATFKIRTRGPDVVTARSANWWRLRLGNHYAVAAVTDVNDGVVTIECRS